MVSLVKFARVTFYQDYQPARTKRVGSMCAAVALVDRLGYRPLGRCDYKLRHGFYAVVSWF